MLPVPKPIGAPGGGTWLFTPSVKSLAQSHGDLERTGSTGKGDERGCGGPFQPAPFFHRDVFYRFSILLIYAENHGGLFCVTLQ